MVSISARYEGSLHCSASHGPSGSVIATDAPKDNQGLGEAFSPTDLVATALATCVLTTIAIAARKHGLELADGAHAHVEKVMTTTGPRRIASLELRVTLPASIPTDKRPALENAGRACPVHHSLHPDVHAPITYTYA